MLLIYLVIAVVTAGVVIVTITKELRHRGGPLTRDKELIHTLIENITKDPQLLSRESQAAIEIASKLTRNQRLILQLRLEQQSFAEIAEKLGMSPQNVVKDYSLIRKETVAIAEKIEFF